MVEGQARLIRTRRHAERVSASTPRPRACGTGRERAHTARPSAHPASTKEGFDAETAEGRGGAEGASPVPRVPHRQAMAWRAISGVGGRFSAADDSGGSRKAVLLSYTEFDPYSATPAIRFTARLERVTSALSVHEEAESAQAILACIDAFPATGDPRTADPLLTRRSGLAMGTHFRVTYFARPLVLASVTESAYVGSC